MYQRLPESTPVALLSFYACRESSRRLLERFEGSESVALTVTNKSMLFSSLHKHVSQRLGVFHCHD